MAGSKILQPYIICFTPNPINMKNWLIPFFCGFSFLHHLSSQQLTPVVLSSNGGVGTSGKLQLEWTLGELAVEGLIGQPRSYTEGFHQPTLQVEQVEMVYPPIRTDSDHEKQTFDHDLTQSGSHRTHDSICFRHRGTTLLPGAGCKRCFALRQDIEYTGW